MNLYTKKEVKSWVKSIVISLVGKVNLFSFHFRKLERQNNANKGHRSMRDAHFYSTAKVKVSFNGLPSCPFCVQIISTSNSVALFAKGKFSKR